MSRRTKLPFKRRVTEGGEGRPLPFKSRLKDGGGTGPRIGPGVREKTLVCAPTANGSLTPESQPQEGPLIHRGLTSGKSEGPPNSELPRGHALTHLCTWTFRPRHLRNFGGKCFEVQNVRSPARENHPTPPSNQARVPQGCNHCRRIRALPLILKKIPKFRTKRNSQRANI